MKKILGIVALGALLAGCGADVEGSWKGTWTDTGGSSGELILELNDSGSEVIGTMTAFGMCLTAGSVSGSVDGDQVTLDIKSGAASAQLIGTANEDELSGTFTIAGGGGCMATKGNWKVVR